MSTTVHNKDLCKGTVPFLLCVALISGLSKLPSPCSNFSCSCAPCVLYCQKLAATRDYSSQQLVTNAIIKQQMLFCSAWTPMPYYQLSLQSSWWMKPILEAHFGRFRIFLPVFPEGSPNGRLAALSKSSSHSFRGEDSGHPGRHQLHHNERSFFWSCWYPPLQPCLPSGLLNTNCHGSTYPHFQLKWPAQLSCILGKPLGVTCKNNHFTFSYVFKLTSWCSSQTSEQVTAVYPDCPDY